MPGRTSDDAVELDALLEGGASNGSLDLGGIINLKVLIALFLVFILVSSSVFTNNVISGIPGAVRQRTTTSFGIVVQGIFLVIFFILSTYMIHGDVI